MFVIAGVTGRTGAVVAQELLGKKEKVKVIVRDAAKGAEWSKRGAEVAVGSLADQAFLTQALKNAKGFFTLLPPNYTSKDVYADQRATADAVAGAVKASGVPHVVMLSSIGADMATHNGPIKGLHYLEEALKKTGTKLTAIRAGSFQENVHMALSAAKKEGIFPSFAPADAPMAMIATKDIGTLAAERLTAASAKSEVIDLHGPSYSNRQVAEKLGKVLGKTLKVVEIPQAGWVQALTQAGLSPHMAEIFTEMYEGFAKGLLTPKGDRLVQGKTPIDEVIAKLAA